MKYRVEKKNSINWNFIWIFCIVYCIMYYMLNAS